MRIVEFVVNTCVFSVKVTASPGVKKPACYNYVEDSGAHSTHIRLPSDVLDVDTVLHEVHHAFLWAFADPDTREVTVSCSAEEHEELHVQGLSTLMNRVVCGLEAGLGRSLRWKEIVV
jgi:hypothetical protein